MSTKIFASSNYVIIIAKKGRFDANSFSDIDGTFQEMGQPVPEINKTAINYLKAQGDHFVFVTGRGYDLVEALMIEEGISCDVIFGNGAGLKLEGQAPVLANCLPLATLEAVTAILEKENVFIFCTPIKE